MPQFPPETVDQTEVSKEFLTPPGYLTIWFSLLETELDLAIWRMLDFGLNDPRAAVVTAQFTSFKAKALFLQALANERTTDPQLQGAISNVVKRVEDVNDARNSLIHGEWLANRLVRDFAHKQSVNARSGKKKIKSRSFTPSAVMEIAEEAVATASALSDCIGRVPPAP